MQEESLTSWLVCPVLCGLEASSVSTVWQTALVLLGPGASKAGSPSGGPGPLTRVPLLSNAHALEC